MLRKGEELDPVLVVMTGAPGSGKTSVLRRLADSGFDVVAEPAREVLASQRAAGGSGTYDRDAALFLDLMLRRAVEDYERAGRRGRSVFFDRGIPDLVTYAALFGLDPSAALAAASERRYHRVVFEMPSWREIYVTDDERKMTFEAARAFGAAVRKVYADLGYELVEVPRQSPHQRARFLLDALGVGPDEVASGAVG